MRGRVFALAVVSAILSGNAAVAQSSGPESSYVRLVLFLPSDVTAPNGVRERLTGAAATTDAFFLKWMNHWGYPPAVKSLFRREADGMVEVLTVRGDQPVASGKYAKPDYAKDVIAQATRQYHVTGKGLVWWIFVYLGDRPSRFNDFGGFGSPREGGWAMVNYDTLPGEYRPDLGPAEGFNGRVFLKGAIHELGHAFGLPHIGPDIGLGLGNSLMGPTNAIYAAHDKPKPDQAYLTDSCAAMLWKHPIFSGNAVDRVDLPNLKMADYAAVFERTGDSVMVSGKLVSNQAAHTAVLVDDRGDKDEYWFPGYVGRISRDGTFRIRIAKPARTNGRYRILFCFDNGMVTGNGTDGVLSNQGYVRKPYRFVDGEFQFIAPPIPAGLKFATPFRDDFNGGLGPGWRWVDPKGDSLNSVETREGFLRIEVKGYHDLWNPGENYNAPRLVREADGDFTLETKIAGPGRWCGGLLVWKDADNFVRLDRGIRFRNDISLGGAIDGEYVSLAHDYVEADPVWLRLERAGSRYTAYYSADGNQWVPLKRTSTGMKRNPPKALEDAASLLKEPDFIFSEARGSLEMPAAGPLLVGISGLVTGIPLPNGVSRTVTDYDYFAIRGGK
jgi:hypothetical protein